MSAETIQWLNENTRIGFTDKRGDAWHKIEGATNHYPGPVPMDEVRKLLDIKPVEGTVESTYVTEDGVTTITDTSRKTIIRPGVGVLGVFKQGFKIHEYVQWLVTNVETLLDGGLAVASVGLLRMGAVAWVQIELPDPIETPEGVTFRPFVSAATSLDGSLASTYQRGITAIVCDNTLAASLAESALRIKIRHSRNSMGRVADVRAALDLIETAGEDFAAEVKALCAIDVSDKQWDAFLDEHLLGGKPADKLSPRSLSLTSTTREQLQQLYKHDERVAPWAGTGYGVLAAVNTHAHHLSIVRNTNRAERNALRTVTGQYDKLDTSTIATLNRVLARV